MIALIFYLLLVPMAFCSLLLGNKKDANASLPYRYVLGFVATYAVFCMLYMPMTLWRASFSTLAVTCTVCFACVCTAAAAKLLCSYVKKSRTKEVVDCEKETKKEQIGRYVCFFAMLCVIGISVYRVVFLQAEYYRDDKTYGSLINDILNSNTLYGVYEFTGEFYEEISQINIKYLLSAWYPYQAMLSWTSGLHPLIIYRTVIAGVVVLCTYFILWELGKRLLPQKKYGSVLFIILYFLLNEVTRKDMDQSLMASTWPSWGKNLVATVVLPLLLVLLMELQKYTTRRNAICLFLASVAGSFASPTGINSIPILIVLVSCSLYIKEKNKTAFWGAMLGLIPPICGTLIYLAWRKGVF